MPIKKIFPVVNKLFDELFDLGRNSSTVGTNELFSTSCHLHTAVMKKTKIISKDVEKHRFITFLVGLNSVWATNATPSCCT